MAFELHGDELTTDAFVGVECEAPGTYRVSVGAGSLALVPIEEPCEFRQILLASKAWTAGAGVPPSDVLEGDWTATFSCERMVRAVRQAPVAAEIEAFWSAALADRYATGPARREDLADPCRDVPEPLTTMFRFSDGRLQIFDPPDLQEGFDGDYDVLGTEIVITDGSDRNIAGGYRVAFRIDGDGVTFDLLGRAGSDAFFVATWESAQFVRTA